MMVNNINVEIISIIGKSFIIKFFPIRLGSLNYTLSLLHFSKAFVDAKQTKLLVWVSVSHELGLVAGGYLNRESSLKLLNISISLVLNSANLCRHVFPSLQLDLFFSSHNETLILGLLWLNFIQLRVLLPLGYYPKFPYNWLAFQEFKFSRVFSEAQKLWHLHNKNISNA